MIIFGWGRRSGELAINDTQRLLLSYRYFSLFWVFSVTFGTRYALATLGRDGWATRPISDEEAGRLVGGEPPQPAFWWRWGLLFLLAAGAVAIVIAVVVTLVGRG